MELKEAREVLDGVIPPPNNKMVDLAHLDVAIAWATVKGELDRRSTAGENGPLTEEQLFDMDGEPVWVVEQIANGRKVGYWCVLTTDDAADEIQYTGGNAMLDVLVKERKFAVDGVTVYRRPPVEVQHEDDD